MMATIKTLQEENKLLSIKNTEFELKVVRLHREIDEGDAEVFKVRCETLKKENERVRKEMKDAYENCDRKLEEMREKLDGQVEEVKEREKISYRDQIVELEAKIVSLGL